MSTFLLRTSIALLALANLAIIEREADAKMAPLLLMGRDFDAWEERGRLLVQMPDRLLDLPAPSLFGGYQHVYVTNPNGAAANDLGTATVSYAAPNYATNGANRSTFTIGVRHNF